MQPFVLPMIVVIIVVMVIWGLIAQRKALKQERPEEKSESPERFARSSSSTDKPLGTPRPRPVGRR